LGTVVWTIADQRAFRTASRSASSGVRPEPHTAHRVGSVVSGASRGTAGFSSARRERPAGLAEQFLIFSVRMLASRGATTLVNGADRSTRRQPFFFAAIAVSSMTRGPARFPTEQAVRHVPLRTARGCLADAVPVLPPAAGGRGGLFESARFCAGWWG